MIAERIADILLEARERVLWTAIRFPNGTVVTAPLHVDCYVKAFKSGMFPEVKDYEDLEFCLANGCGGVSDVEEGFVSSTGRFLNRNEAFYLETEGRMPKGEDEYLTIDSAHMPDVQKATPTKTWKKGVKVK